MNTALMFGCLLLVAGFRSSSAPTASSVDDRTRLRDDRARRGTHTARMTLTSPSLGYDHFFGIFGCCADYFNHGADVLRAYPLPVPGLASQLHEEETPVERHGYMTIYSAIGRYRWSKATAVGGAG
jgi:hypothetical protein